MNASPENVREETTKDEIFSKFKKRCKANMHILFCFSHIGDNLRQTCRMYPSLISCTTIDWFSLWPLNALEAVA